MCSACKYVSIKEISCGKWTLTYLLTYDLEVFFLSSNECMTVRVASLSAVFLIDPSCADFSEVVLLQSGVVRLRLDLYV